MTLEIRGRFQGPWFLGFSNTATSCVSFPNVFASLSLDPPITLLLSGTFTIGDVLAECPGGLSMVAVPMPATLPPGLNFSIQALCEAFDVLSIPSWHFTRAITVTTI